MTLLGDCENFFGTVEWNDAASEDAAGNLRGRIDDALRAAGITAQKIGFESSKLKDVLERVKSEAERGSDTLAFWSWTGDPQIGEELEKELINR